MERVEPDNFNEYFLDESFHEYVRGYPQSSVEGWKRWLADHPERAEEVSSAKEIIAVMLHPSMADVTVDKQKASRDLLTRIRLEKRGGQRMLTPAWVKVAAILLMGLGLGWFLKMYQGGNVPDDDVIAYNEIIVPIGEKSQLVLSDGTHVWINSGSHFKYPSQFKAKSREVFLTGEAFFDVEHDEEKAFTVTTKDSQIKVLGTAFNVKSYPDDAKTRTTVVRGLVSVQSTLHKIPAVFIHPNQAVEIKSDYVQSQSGDNTLKILDEVNVNASISWKDQSLVFADEPLEDMVKKMERWFNVKIVLNDERLRQERYNGKFVNNETVYQVLEAIKITTPIQYSAKNNEIIITRKR